MEDVVQEAHNIVANLDRDGKGKINLTVTQIRKFLTAVNAINNKLLAYQSQTGAGKDLKILPPELADEIRFLEVKLAYQCGREKRDKEVVRDFATKAKLIERIQAIGNSAAKYREFARLVEAIVAFHRYEGGRE